jgi:acetone carboxylase gamma subunit
MRFSNTLKIEKDATGARVLCAACDAVLAPTSQNWRQGATLQTQAVEALGGPYSTGRNLILRQFVCPQCGQLLDSELALPSDPWIDDRLFVADGA